MKKRLFTLLLMALMLICACVPMFCACNQSEAEKIAISEFVGEYFRDDEYFGCRYSDGDDGHTILDLQSGVRSIGVDGCMLYNPSIEADYYKKFTEKYDENLIKCINDTLDKVGTKMVFEADKIIFADTGTVFNYTNHRGFVNSGTGPLLLDYFGQSAYDPTMIIGLRCYNPNVMVERKKDYTDLRTIVVEIGGKAQDANGKKYVYDVTVNFNNGK